MATIAVFADARPPKEIALVKITGIRLDDIRVFGGSNFIPLGLV